MGVKDFSNELNWKKSLNLIQYLEDDILNYTYKLSCFVGHPVQKINDDIKLTSLSDKSYNFIPWV